MLICNMYIIWDPPSNIFYLVNSYTDHIPHVGGYGDIVSIAHSPAASTNLGHPCDWRCCNYLLQTLATLDKPLFQYLIGPQEKEATSNQQ